MADEQSQLLQELQQESSVKRKHGDSDGLSTAPKRPRKEQSPGLPDVDTSEVDGAAAAVRGKSPLMTSEEVSDDVFLSYDATELEGEGDDVTAQVNRFFAELDVDTTKQRRRLLAEGIKTPRRRSVLPHHLHSVMGSANLRLARGDTFGAIELCMEVIRQAPETAEPYLTLATIYEDTGDRQKLLQILLIVAHLKRSDSDLWVKTARLAMEQEDLSLAAQCFSKASRLNPQNPSLLWQKASLYHAIKEYKKSLEAYDQLFKILPPSSVRDYIEISKEVARLYHNIDNTPKAMEVLSTALNTHPAHADDEAINLLAELYVVSKKYQEAYDVITSLYRMVPQTSDAGGDSADTASVKSKSETAPDHVISHDSHATLETTSEHMISHDSHVLQPQANLDSESFPLTAALRMSIAGEGLAEQEELGEQGDSQPTADDRAGSHPVELDIPEDLAVDIRVKLAVCLIYLGMDVPESLTAPILPNPEEYGDLFLDVADAYQENGQYSKALPLLSALVNTERYSQAGVWLKHAECLHMQGDMEAAAVSYSKVIALAPNHTATRITLAMVYGQLGHVDDALALLEDPDASQEATDGEGEGEGEREEEEDKVQEVKEHPGQDIRLLLHKYNLLVNEGRLADYAEAGSELVAFLLRDVHHRSDVKVLVHQGPKYLQARLRERQVRKESTDVKLALREREGLLSLQEWWKVFHTTGVGLYKMGDAYHYRLQHFIYCAKCLRKFESVADRKVEMSFILFATSIFILLGNHTMAFTFLKQLCTKYPYNKLIWNIINQIPSDIRMQKFVLRLCFKNPDNPILAWISSNYSHTSSSYKLALSQYELAYRQWPNDYLLCLCIACVYISMACQRLFAHVKNKSALVTQGIGFLHKYVRLRGKCQESMYNIARAFHQLGVVHFACHFYKQVLLLEPECKLTQWSRVSDLRSEAAFNLSLIYRASGNNKLALHILRKFCRV